MTQQLAPGTQFLAADGTYRVVEPDGSQSIIRPTPELKAQLDAAAGFAPPADTPSPAAAQPEQVMPTQATAPQTGQVGLAGVFGQGPALAQPEPGPAPAGIVTTGPPLGAAKPVEQTVASVVPAPEAPAYAQTGGTSNLTDDLAQTASGVRVPRLKPHDMHGFVVENPDNMVPMNTNEIEIVILAGGPRVKVLYPGPYQTGVKSRPICSSSNGVTPDIGVPQAQSQTCVACPHNQFGTDGKGKKCKDRRRLAVIDLRSPNMVMQMDLPVSHTIALGEYAQHLSRSKGSVEWAKTVIRSKKAEGMSWMELEFIFNGWVTEQEMQTIDSIKAEHADLIRAATDPGGKASGANQIAHQQAPAQVTHQAQAVGQPAQQAGFPAQGVAHG